MGIFDLFGREPKTENTRATDLHLDGLKESTPPDNAKSPVSVFSPTSYSDVEIIIDALKSGKNTIVHLTELKTETALRVLDMLSGAIYALGGGVYEMGKNVFMFSPTGLEIK